MRLNRACKMIPLAAASLLAAMAAQADIIDYAVTGTIAQVDSGWMLPGNLSSAVAGQAFNFNFSVDTGTPGSGSLDDVSYLSAVQSASYKFGGSTVPFSVGLNSVEVLNNSAAYTGNTAYASGYIMNGGDSPPADFTGTLGAVSFVTLAFSAAPVNLYTDGSLSNSPLSAAQANVEDDLNLYYTSYVNGVAQTTISDLLVGPLSITQSSGTVSAPEIDPASGAAGLSLLCGIAAVLGARRKSAVRVA